MFDSPEKLALGFLTGIVFGFLLQKGRVGKFEVIVGQFLLKDWQVLKVMLVAMAVGSIGVYGLVEADLATLSIKPFLYGGVLIGAVLFGPDARQREKQAGNGKTLHHGGGSCDPPGGCGLGRVAATHRRQWEIAVVRSGARVGALPGASHFAITACQDASTWPSRNSAS